MTGATGNRLMETLASRDVLLPEVVVGLGCVPLADYGMPGTPALTAPSP